MKTGTTSIQHSLAEAKSSGALGTVCYPLWNREVQQSRLAVHYCPEGLAEWPSLRERYPANDLELNRVRRRYRAFVFDELRAARSAVVSSEAFGHLFTPFHAARFREDLESLGFRAFCVVLYVRDPADYYLSMVQQTLKMSDNLPLIKEPATFKYPFLRMAETWERVFPGELVVRRFPAGPHHDAVRDFSALLQECLGPALPRENPRKNVTLSAEAMKILQDYRQTFASNGGVLLTTEDRELISRLSQLSDEFPQTRPQLKPEIAEHIRRNHAEDAELLRARYRVDLGLSHAGTQTLHERSQPYRVEEIVEAVDPEIVYQLLLRAVGRDAHPPLRRSIVRRAYRAVTRLYSRTRTTPQQHVSTCSPRTSAFRFADPRCR